MVGPMRAVVLAILLSANAAGAAPWRLETDFDGAGPSVRFALDAHGAPPAKPLLFQARVASHQAQSSDAGSLGIPNELDDGKPTTYWREDLANSDGSGQFFTFERRLAKARAAQLRIVPGNPTSASTIK